MCTILKNISGETALELLDSYSIPLEAPIQLSKLLQNIGVSTLGIDFSDIEAKANYDRGAILGAAIGYFKR